MFRSLSAPGPGLAAAVALVAAVLVLAALGDPARDALRYDRPALAAGEWWRLVSGHLVHLGWRHAVLDLAAAVVIGWVFGGVFTAARWAWVLGLALVAVNAGLWWLDPELDWYVGLSGVLHGAVAAVAVGLALGREPVGYALLAALVLKLGVEQWLGPLWLTAEAAGGPVVVNAHLYGAVGGAVAAIVPGRRAGKAIIAP